MRTGSFPGIKRPGRGFDQPLPSSAEVKERVEVYLYSTLCAFVACSGVKFYLYHYRVQCVLLDCPKTRKWWQVYISKKWLTEEGVAYVTISSCIGRTFSVDLERYLGKFNCKSFNKIKEILMMYSVERGLPPWHRFIRRQYSTRKTRMDWTVYKIYLYIQCSWGSLLVRNIVLR